MPEDGAAARLKCPADEDASAGQLACAELPEGELVRRRTTILAANCRKIAAVTEISLTRRTVQRVKAVVRFGGLSFGEAAPAVWRMLAAIRRALSLFSRSVAERAGPIRATGQGQVQRIN